MLLSVENYIPRKRVGDRAAMEMLREAGFTGLDFSFFSMNDWDELVDAPGAVQRAEMLRKTAEEAGIVLSQSHAPFRFRYGMEMNESEPEYYKIVKSMEFAAAMGIPAIVVHSIMTNDGSDMLDVNERYYGSLLPYAERFGIQIAVENLTGRRPPDNIPSPDNLGSPETFRAMQDRLDSPYICGCLDIGHANLTLKDAPKFIRECEGYVQYLHTHDNDGFHDNHLLPVLAPYFDEEGRFLGDRKDPLKNSGIFTVPWGGVLEALRDIHYQGPFNLEIPRYIDSFTTEDLPLALKLAANVGQKMMQVVLGE